jgi:hypothetical protein
MTVPASIGLADFASPHAAGATSARAGYGVALTDVAAFEQALAQASAAGNGHGMTVQATQAVQGPGKAMQALFRPLEHINGEAAQLRADARKAAEEGRPLSPGEVVMMTVKAQEFMFHCQLTANVANRTSDGLQQLFRQQS